MIELIKHCSIVKGSKYSILQDNWRGQLIRIPEYVVDYLHNKNIKDISEELKEEITIFFASYEILKPKSEKFIYHKKTNIKLELCTIQSFILNFSEGIEKFIPMIFFQLNSLNCRHIEIRINSNIEQSKLVSLIDLCITHNMYSLDIYSIYFDFSIFNFCIELLKKFPIINLFCIHNVDHYAREKQMVCNLSTYPNIIILEEDLSDVKCCGNIETNNFRIGLDAYQISLKHNSCLNRKISIDSEGNIKNCPSMTESFGNIRDTTLAEAIEKPGFKKYWDINKDKIHVCKDCEFRYICTDCRAYVEDPEDILSKPLKCGYNPYTGEWSEWSTNPLKQKAIDFYGMRDLTED